MILWTQLNALMGHVEHAGSGTQASLELGFQFTTGRPLPFAPILKKNLRLPESSFSSTLTLSLGGSRSETRCVPRPFYGCRESLVSIIIHFVHDHCEFRMSLNWNSIAFRQSSRSLELKIMIFWVLKIKKQLILVTSIWWIRLGFGARRFSKKLFDGNEKHGNLKNECPSLFD